MCPGGRGAVADIASAESDGNPKMRNRTLPRVALVTALLLALGLGSVIVTREGSTAPSGKLGHIAPASGQPSVSLVTPSCGPIAGGTTVAIAGSGFTGATAVDFGPTAATSYTVNSDTSVTAISPAGSAGTVDVTVTTGGGTSSPVSSDEFSYAGCAYVANFTSGTVSVIDTANSTVTETIVLPTTAPPPHPDALALTTDGEQLYVADPANEIVEVYSTATYGIETSSDLTSGIADPTKLDIVNGTTTSLLVANSAAATINAYTLSSDLPASGTPSHTVTAPYLGGLGALSTVFGTTKVMFPSTAGNAVGELSPSSWTTSEVPSASGQFVEPDAIGYSTDGTTAYVAEETGSIYAVSTSTLTVTGVISGTAGVTSVPSAIWCTSSSKCVEANAGNNTIGTISTSSSPGSMAGSPISSPDIDGPVALAPVPSTSTLLVVNDGGGSVGIFDAATDQMTGQIAVGTNPCAIVVMKS